MTKRPRQYDREFKLNAIKLYLESKDSYKSVGSQLGMPHRTLGTWVENFKKHGEEAFSSKGHTNPSDMDVSELRRELQIAREERDILKKALGIFSSPKK